MTKNWNCRLFSLANPRSDRTDDLSELLRRTAGEIEERGTKPIEILDLTVSSEITEDGPSWSATLYWWPGEEADDAPKCW